ncbi:MAG TPA: hypothetical protein VF444_09120, partial [Pseudonocardiaceae bacterium]
ERTARARVLAAKAAAYQRLRREATDAVRGFRDEPGYPAVRAGLVAAARAMLGPDAEIIDDPGGGIMASAAGRRLDQTLRTVAARALDQLGPEVETLWER